MVEQLGIEPSPQRLQGAGATSATQPQSSRAEIRTPIRRLTAARTTVVLHEIGTPGEFRHPDPLVKS